MKEKLKRLACDPRALLWLWVLIAVSGMTRLGHGRENNFLIFKYVYWHVVGQQPLYEHYPAEYFDMNHYGPFFSLVIAPFALPPVWLGMLLWLVALTLALYVAVRHNFFTRWQQVVIFWFCSHELLNAIQMQQFNIAIAAIIVGSYYLIRKERDFWAAFLIMLGTFVKLYGIVGLALLGSGDVCGADGHLLACLHRRPVSGVVREPRGEECRQHVQPGHEHLSCGHGT